MASNIPNSHQEHQEPLLSGSGSQLRLRGKLVNGLINDKTTRIPWLPGHFLEFQRFLAKYTPSKKSIKADPAFSLLLKTELAARIRLDTSRLSEIQWLAVREKIRTALLYRYDLFRKEKVVTDKWSEEHGAVIDVWDQEAVGRVLSPQWQGLPFEILTDDNWEPSLMDVDMDVDVDADVGGDNRLGSNYGRSQSEPLQSQQPPHACYPTQQNRVHQQTYNTGPSFQSFSSDGSASRSEPHQQVAHVQQHQQHQQHQQPSQPPQQASHQFPAQQHGQGHPPQHPQTNAPDDAIRLQHLREQIRLTQQQRDQEAGLRRQREIQDEADRLQEQRRRDQDGERCRQREAQAEAVRLQEELRIVQEERESVGSAATKPRRSRRRGHRGAKGNKQGSAVYSDASAFLVGSSRPQPNDIQATDSDPSEPPRVFTSDGHYRNATSNASHISISSRSLSPSTLSEDQQAHSKASDPRSSRSSPGGNRRQQRNFNTPPPTSTSRSYSQASSSISPEFERLKDRLNEFRDNTSQPALVPASSLSPISSVLHLPWSKRQRQHPVLLTSQPDNGEGSIGSGRGAQSQPHYSFLTPHDAQSSTPTTRQAPPPNQPPSQQHHAAPGWDPQQNWHIIGQGCNAAASNITRANDSKRGGGSRPSRPPSSTSSACRHQQAVSPNLHNHGRGKNSNQSEGSEGKQPASQPGPQSAPFHGRPHFGFPFRRGFRSPAGPPQYQQEQQQQQPSAGWGPGSQNGYGQSNRVGQPQPASSRQNHAGHSPPENKIPWPLRWVSQQTQQPKQQQHGAAHNPRAAASNRSSKSTTRHPNLRPSPSSLHESRQPPTATPKTTIHDLLDASIEERKVLLCQSIADSNRQWGVLHEQNIWPAGLGSPDMTWSTAIRLYVERQRKERALFALSGMHGQAHGPETAMLYPLASLLSDEEEASRELGAFGRLAVQGLRYV